LTGIQGPGWWGPHSIEKNPTAQHTWQLLAAICLLNQGVSNNIKLAEPGINQSRVSHSVLR